MAKEGKNQKTKSTEKLEDPKANLDDRGVKGKFEAGKERSLTKKVLIENIKGKTRRLEDIVVSTVKSRQVASVRLVGEEGSIMRQGRALCVYFDEDPADWDFVIADCDPGDPL